MESHQRRSDPNRYVQVCEMSAGHRNIHDAVSFRVDLREDEVDSLLLLIWSQVEIR